MIRKPTVFVVGAGASYEIGLPLGATLKQRVSDALRFRFDFPSRLISGDSNLLEAIRHKFGEQHVNAHLHASNELTEVIPTFPSIDEALNYFSTRPEIIECGKTAIVSEILKAERSCALKFEPQLGAPAIASADHSWLQHFFSIAMSSIRKEQVESVFDHVTFINFNYDRILEHYLFWALQNRALVPESTAASIVSKTKIIRPYGKVGALDRIDRRGTPFGFNARGSKLFELASEIRTYTEQCATEIPTAIDEALSSASVIIVIGFGFHSQNVDLLMPLSKRKARSIKVFATVKGIHSANHSELLTQLRKVANSPNVTLMDTSSAGLLTDMRPAISAAVS